MSSAEIVTIQVGQCGNQIGTNFWQKVNEEYKLDENCSFVGKDNERFSYDYMGTYFRSESNEKKYTPRTVLVDLDRTVLDDIKQSKLNNYFDSKNFFYSNTELSVNSGIRSGENNWAIGHYTDGFKIVDRVLDAVRKEAEACDCIQGFNVIHSLAGGTGSGFGTLMISKIREEYPDRLMLTNTVLPSPSPHSANVLEAYNSVLSVHQLVENTDLTVNYDNLALRNVYLNRLNQKSFTLDDQNSIISRCMLNQTSCMRLPRQQEIDLRKMAVNLVCFPRLHFLLPFLSFSSNKGLIDAFTDTLTNNLACVDYRHGRFLSLANIYRGRDLSLEEILNQTRNLQNKNSSHFVEWITKNCVIGVCQEPEKNIQVSSTFISNTTAIEEPFKRISENFAAMFRRKAFLHHYTGEGMDEMEFAEAESNVNDLVSEYQQYRVANEDIEGEAGEEETEQA